MTDQGRAPRSAVGTSLVTALAPVLWGTTYYVTTEFLPPGRPLLTGALRALGAGLLVLVVARELPRGVWWLRSAVLGGLNFGLFFGFLFAAAYRLPGGVAATIAAIQPLIAAVLAAILLGEAMRRRIVVAGLLGVVGVSLLVLRPDAALDPLGVAAALGGAVSFAGGTVLVKRWSPPTTLLAFTSWQLVAGGVLLAPVALLVEGAPPALTAANLGGYAWLLVLGTALAYACWFSGIGKLPVAQVTLLTLLIPVVALLIGIVVAHEQLNLLQATGVAVVLTALWIGRPRLDG